jgi:aspartate aminotransferase-like enzyme
MTIETSDVASDVHDYGIGVTMTHTDDFGRFFLPGPTEVRPETLQAMLRPIIGHRGPEISELIQGMDQRLSDLFVTDRPVYLCTSSATGMMEAAITNLTRRRVLCLVNGSFSRRFYDIAMACGRPADRLEVEWGEPNLPETLHDALVEKPGRYDLVTVVHSESSTGVLNPLADISKVVHQFEDVLLAVDSVSSLAAAPVRTKEWKLDFVLAGSQKALALPPGLALAAASERALARAQDVEHRGFYFDLLKFDKRMRSHHQTPNTPVVSIFYALEQQLSRIAEEGLEARWERHRRMAERTYAWVDELTSRTGRSFSVFAPEGYRSPALTPILLPDGMSGPDVAAAARERGYTIAPGYGKMKPQMIRIGHMGEHAMDELEALLSALDEVLDA